jgi:siroheme synthase
MTPAVAVASATLAEQDQLGSTIADIALVAEALPTGAPVTVIIGWVARNHVAPLADLIPFRIAS